MAKMTKAEVRKRALKRDAANVDPGYGAALGQAFRESGADLGEGLVGRGAGYLNTLQKLFTGVDKVGLRAAQDKGTAANQRVFEDVEAAGGGKAAWAYTIAREMGIGAAEYAALGGLGKGISALSKLRKGASAAEAAAAAAKAGVPPQVAKGLWGLIKRHKAASAIVGAGLVGGGVMGAQSIAEDEQNRLATAQAEANRQASLQGSGKSTPSAPPTGDGTGKRGLGGAGRTYEDFIKAALTQAGFGTPEAKAYHYDPWGQTGGNAPYQAALTGGHPAFNPNIVGGRAPTIKDAQRLNQGTQQSQNTYADALDAQGQAMGRNAMAQAGPAYVAYQKGQGLRQGLAIKDKADQERNLVNYYTRTNAEITRREKADADNPQPGVAATLVGARADLEAEFEQGRKALGMFTPQV